MNILNVIFFIINGVIYFKEYMLPQTNKADYQITIIQQYNDCVWSSP